MILEVVQSKWSLTWYDPLGPRMCVLELMNGHVLQTLREQLKVPGSRLEGSELLTSEFLRFRSRLNETSGGLGKIGAVSGLVLLYGMFVACGIWCLADVLSICPSLEQTTCYACS